MPIVVDTVSSRDTFTAEVPKDIEEASEFLSWEEDADGSQFEKVEAAKEKIKSEGVITSAKSLDEGLFEKKWTSGLRLYFAIVEMSGRKTLLILGSGKGSEQNKAIKEARKILKGYKVYKGNIKKKD